MKLPRRLGKLQDVWWNTLRNQWLEPRIWFIAFDMLVTYLAFKARLALPVIEEPTAIRITYAVRLLTATLFILFCIYKRGQTWENFGIRKKEVLSDVFWSLRFTVVPTAVVLLTLWLLTWEQSTRDPVPASSELSYFQTVVVWVDDVLFKPGVEELIYRGILLPPLVTRIGAIRAILLNTIIFCFLHIGPYHAGLYWPGVLVWGLLGLLLATAFYMRKSVVFTILIHGAANALLTVWQRTYHAL